MKMMLCLMLQLLVTSFTATVLAEEPRITKFLLNGIQYSKDNRQPIVIPMKTDFTFRCEINTASENTNITLTDEVGHVLNSTKNTVVLEYTLTPNKCEAQGAYRCLVRVGEKILDDSIAYVVTNTCYPIMCKNPPTPKTFLAPIGSHANISLCIIANQSIFNPLHLQLNGVNISKKASTMQTEKIKYSYEIEPTNNSPIHYRVNVYIYDIKPDDYTLKSIQAKASYPILIPYSFEFKQIRVACPNNICKTSTCLSYTNSTAREVSEVCGAQDGKLAGHVLQDCNSEKRNSDEVLLSESSGCVVYNHKTKFVRQCTRDDNSTTLPSGCLIYDKNKATNLVQQTSFYLLVLFAFFTNRPS
ncbi:uncharacterized protein LOC131927393 [Physella acuta]|uniref:uncharacterized protein LOC131927393 n=1 Tax=Physella acuta TaxID=109671 RepID=UPI0027DAFA32|nr:uncharacterized protein LOC131927393 [Physella acuta]XP_059139084.1 uncharacterized protein LOC131927393 [Physella acuta]